LAKDDKHSPKASLPKDIRTPIEKSLSDSAEALAHVDVEEDFAPKVKDQAQLDGGIADAFSAHARG
jgi:hypothetical protein